MRVELGGDRLFLQDFLRHTQTSEFHPRANGNLVEDFRQCRDDLVLFRISNDSSVKNSMGKMRAGAGSGRAHSNKEQVGLTGRCDQTAMVLCPHLQPHGT